MMLDMDAQNYPLVVINAHLLSADASYRSAGIATYIAQLISHLTGTGSSLRYHCLAGSTAPWNSSMPPLTRSSFRTDSPIRRIIWEQAMLPGQLRRLQADVSHAPAFIGPLLSSVPQVVTVHDLSFLRYPQFFRTGNRLYLSSFTGLSCRHAKAVIAVSKHTAREVVSLLHVPETKVTTIFSGVDARYLRYNDDDIAAFRLAKGLPDDYILYLGTLEPRKNLLRLIRAYAAISKSTKARLVIAGAKGWFYEDIFAEVQRLQLDSRVLFPGYIASDELPLWYNAARAFAYVSLYEGFGLPVLEALACGVPVLTSATTSLPEASGGIAVQVDPESEPAIAEGLLRLLSDDDLRQHSLTAGPEHARAFTWESTALQTASVYESVAIS